MKKNIIIAFFLILVFSHSPVEAAPMVIYDDNLIMFENSAQPIVEDGRTLVPLRTIFEAMGAEVQWDDSTQTVTATKGTTEIMLTIGGSAYKNGQPVNLDVPAKLVSNRTMVPLRFVGEAFGAKVDWNENFKTVVISTNQDNSCILENLTLLNKDFLNAYLIEQSKEGNGYGVESLLKAGADPDATDKFGQTPLMLASWRGYTYTVNALLLAGANVNKSTSGNYTAITAAAGQGHVDTVKVLLKAGANPNSTTSYGSTPLSSAVQDGYSDVVKALLDGGADPNLKGMTFVPLYSAIYPIRKPDEAIKNVKYLLDAGANPNIKRDNGVPVFFDCVANGSVEVVKLLVKAGVNPNEKFQTVTPLMVASDKGNVDMVKTLLSLGSDPNVKSDNGLTALSIAQKHEYQKIADILKEVGAKQ